MCGIILNNIYLHFSVSKHTIIFEIDLVTSLEWNLINFSQIFATNLVYMVYICTYMIWCRKSRIFAVTSQKTWKSHFNLVFEIVCLILLLSYGRASLYLSFMWLNFFLTLFPLVFKYTPFSPISLVSTKKFEICIQFIWQNFGFVQTP